MHLVAQKISLKMHLFYLPLQDAYGSPDYFDLDKHAIYEIHNDNTRDALEDITFRIRFQGIRNDLQLDI